MTTRRKRPGGTIDWTDAHRRLERVIGATAEPSRSDDRARALLDERARRLARVHVDPAVDDRLELVVFVHGSERYALASAIVHEVVRFAEVTPLPGAPAIAVGVMNHRGQVLALFDVRALGGHRPRRADTAAVIVLGATKPQFGIVAERVDELVRLAPRDIHPVPALGSNRDAAWLRGVTSDATLIIDGDALLTDARLFVEQPDA